MTAAPTAPLPEALTGQLITCIGNKRALLPPIRTAVEAVCARLGRRDLRILEPFSGSGAVSRLLKHYAGELVVNDLEAYAEAAGHCFLANRADVPGGLADRVAALNAAVLAPSAPTGFIRELYAPADAEDIRAGERAFYTPENARRLDAYRQLLDAEDPQTRRLLLGPLLSAASVHANTAGVFKGFYKDRRTGVGRYGGSGADALRRITAPIVLAPPVLGPCDADIAVHRGDANALVRDAGGFDLAYLDPPYNQHPYGSNYFMLNLLTDYERPAVISTVSGIPAGWRRSDYNVRARSLPRLRDLLEHLDASFVILSYNDEGFVAPDAMRALLQTFGRVTESRQVHATFRGSRNLRDRPAHVTEHVYLVERT